ncbi:MAG: hypothetical protein ABF991_13395 [Liquorilactobacillus hordei]|uniref:ArnT family glycosyltransferase n=1 Tax=Liquorilactobacillus hordei TaxID=468911 RepID=UPI0039E7D838
MYFLARLTILILVTIIIFFIVHNGSKEKGEAKYLYGAATLIILYSIFMMYKINNFPNVFLDEGNGMYDSWSLAHYGVDSNLIKNPVYLEGFQGQGQSILYSLLAKPFLKLLGYELYAFRLPLVIASIINLLLIFYVSSKYFSRKKTFWTVVVFSSSPWVLAVSRFGMDCNIAPFMVSIGSLIFFLGVMMKKKILKTVLVTIGMLIIGLTAYAYNVGWIFLAVYLPVLLIYLLHRKALKINELIIPLFLLVIEITPILIFAVRSNCAPLNNTIKILFWTSPELQIGRVNASFINFHGNMFVQIYNNICSGLLMYINGTDGLSWNSVGNFGPYYMFTLPFFIVGILTILKRRTIWDSIILAQLTGMLIIICVVLPNYNHWIFIHFPVLEVISIGLIEVSKNTKQMGKALLVTYVVFTVAFVEQYFNNSRYTGWETSAISEVKKLDLLSYKRVFFASDDPNFVYEMRFILPVSPYEFQKTKDNPYSKKDLATKNKYANFVALPPDSKINIDTIIIIQQGKEKQFSTMLNKMKLHNTFTINSLNYNVYKKR